MQDGQVYVLDPLGDWSASFGYKFDYDKKGTVPDYIPIFGGNNEFKIEADLVGQANQSGANVSGNINASLDLFDERVSGKGGGTASVNWILDDQTCRYVFSNADTSLSVGVEGRFPLPSLYHKSWWLKVEVGVVAQGSLSGNIVWVANSNITNSSQSSVNASLGLGFYGEISVLDDAAKAEVTGTGQFEFDVETSGIELADAYFDLKGEVAFGRFKFELQTRYPSGARIVYDSLDHALLSPMSEPNNTEVIVSLNNKVGSNSVYMGEAILDNISADVTDDGAPVIVKNSNGEVYAFWTREPEDVTASFAGTVMYAQYDGDSWSLPQIVPNISGFNYELGAAPDQNGNIVLVLRNGDSTDFSLGSDADEVYEAVKNGQITTVRLDEHGSWSTPHMLTAESQKYRWVTVEQLANDNVFVAWIEDSPTNSRELWVASWNGVSWSSTNLVVTGDIYGKANFVAIEGNPSIVWTQAIDNDKVDQNGPTNLYLASFVNDNWSAPSLMEFQLNSSITTSPLEKNRPNSLADGIFKLDIAPPTSICEPEVPEEPQNPPTPPPNEQNPEDTDESVSVRSFDPNEKVGPVGFGNAHIISDAEKLHYTIFFENEPNKATAPAQEVFIIDQLDSDLDWQTIQFEEVAFGDVIIPVDHEVGELTFYSRETISDYRSAVSKLWWIDIIGEINPVTGLVNWSLRMLDPDTGDLPDDPFAGFLPPNDDNGIGEGHVSFSIESAESVEIGTIITNKANIIFDTNEAIITNETTNMIGVPGYFIYLPLTIK